MNVFPFAGKDQSGSQCSLQSGQALILSCRLQQDTLAYGTVLLACWSCLSQTALLAYFGKGRCPLCLQAYLGDKADVSLHLGTRITGYAPNSEEAISKHNTHTIPYHTITVPYRTIPNYTIPYHTIPYHTIPYRTIPYHTIPYHTIPYHTIPYHTMLDTPQHTAVNIP